MGVFLPRRTLLLSGRFGRRQRGADPSRLRYRVSFFAGAAAPSRRPGAVQGPLDTFAAVICLLGAAVANRRDRNTTAPRLRS